MGVHVGSVGSNFGREINSQMPENISCSYLMKKVFKIPILGEVQFWGDGKKSLPEWFGIKPTGYLFNFNINPERIGYFGREDFLMLNILCSNSDYKQRITNLIEINDNPEVELNLENFQNVSNSLYKLEDSLTNLESKFRESGKLIQFKKAIFSGRYENGTSCECCLSSYSNLDSKYITKNSEGINGFKRLTLYSALTGKKLERERAGKVIDSKRLKPLEKRILINIEQAEKIGEEFNKYGI